MATESTRRPTLFRLIMLPSNYICDALKIADEHERGMVRMLVNMLAFITVAVTVLMLVWLA